MISSLDENLKKQITRDGSHLKYTRCTGGGGAALIAFGCCIAVIAAILAVCIFPLTGYEAAIVIAAIGILIGFFIALPGIFMRKKRISNYLKYYVKKSGYTESELQGFEREFQNGLSLFVNPYKRIHSNAKRDCGIITEHWIKMPFMLPISYSGLYRFVDIAAIWYDKKPYINFTEMSPSIFVVDSIGTLIRFGLAEEVGYQLIEEVAKRNPKVITSRRFSVDGQDFDAQTDPVKVAEIYRIACTKAS